MFDIARNNAIENGNNGKRLKTDKNERTWRKYAI